MTVTGPVESRSLGVTLPHEHVLIDLFVAPSRWDIAGILFDVDVMVDELMHFRNAGGTTLVDTTLPAIKRDPDGLRSISERTGVQIVMGCGWYREPYYPPEDAIDRVSVDELADRLVQEIDEGTGEQAVRPGIIGEIGCHKAWMSAQEERVHRAAARAQKATGLALTTHSMASPIGLRQLDILEEEGVDPARVVIGHADSYPVWDYHLAIVRRGAYVQFDKVGDPHAFFLPEARLVRSVCDLVEAGYLEQILLSHDICFRSHLKYMGGHGYDYLLTKFVPALLEAGLSLQEVDTIVRDNPQRMLSLPS
jgi:predicted metal-dependent phosphotriesterase family hydrolase